MTCLSAITDFGHKKGHAEKRGRSTVLSVHCYGIKSQNFKNFEAIWLLPNVTSKMLSELAGIRMAAISGARVPCTANAIPMMLYTIDRIKLAMTICLLIRHKWMNCGKF